MLQSLHIDFGGKDAKGKTSDTLYVFHTGRKEWNKPSIQSLQPAPRHSHAACVIGTIMYVTCGQLSGFYMNDIVAFDMKTRKSLSRLCKYLCLLLFANVTCLLLFGASSCRKAGGQKNTIG